MCAGKCISSFQVFVILFSLCYKFKTRQFKAGHIPHLQSSPLVHLAPGVSKLLLLLACKCLALLSRHVFLRSPPSRSRCIFTGVATSVLSSFYLFLLLSCLVKRLSHTKSLFSFFVLSVTKSSAFTFCAMIPVLYS